MGILAENSSPNSCIITWGNMAKRGLEDCRLPNTRRTLWNSLSWTGCIKRAGTISISMYMPIRKEEFFQGSVHRWRMRERQLSSKISLYWLLKQISHSLNHIHTNKNRLIYMLNIHIHIHIRALIKKTDINLREQREGFEIWKLWWDG